MTRRVKIADRWLGDGCSPFIVAEAGINHNGKLVTALEMIHVARDAGCDAIKFATLKAAEFCNPAHLISYTYQGELVTEPEIEMFRRTELPAGAWPILKDECDRIGITFFSTPQNYSDLEILLSAGVPCVKVGSDDLTNLALIMRYALTGLPIILSTGMADREDVEAAVTAAGRTGVIVLACTSEYPCPLEHANVGRVTTLQKMLPYVPIGYSDHTRGTAASAAATALGACYLEKHFTLNNAARGPDHQFSASPIHLYAWVKAIRDAHEAVGHGRIEPTDEEKVNRVNWRRTSGQQIRGEKAKES